MLVRHVLLILSLAAFVYSCSVSDSGRVSNKIMLDTVVTNVGEKIRILADVINDSTCMLKFNSNGKDFLIDSLIAPRSISYFTVIDFDKNGSTDILVDYIANNSECYLYLFDSVDFKFKFVEGYVRFPAGEQLTSNPALYYSYHRAGCGDMDWVSDLFTIQDFSTIHLGQLYAEACDSSDPRQISMFKVLNNTDEEISLIERFPYPDTIDDKYEFIEEYWNKNYLKFK